MIRPQGSNRRRIDFAHSGSISLATWSVVSRPRFYWSILLLCLCSLSVLKLSVDGSLQMRLSELEEHRVQFRSLALRQEVYELHVDDYREWNDPAGSTENHRVVWLDSVRSIIKELDLTHSTVRFRAPRLFNVESESSSSLSDPSNASASRSDISRAESKLLLYQYGLELKGLVRHEGLLLEIIRRLIDGDLDRMVNQSCLLARSDWQSVVDELPEFAARLVREARWTTSTNPVSATHSKTPVDQSTPGLRYYCLFNGFQLSVQ